MPDLLALKQFIIPYCADIVSEVSIRSIADMRVFLVDTSFLDIWYSPRTIEKYSYYWERQYVGNIIYRHDNALHVRWKNIPTHPKHFHSETEYNVIESYISDIPEEAVTMFMSFVRAKLIKDDGY